MAWNLPVSPGSSHEKQLWALWVTVQRGNQRIGITYGGGNEYHFGVMRRMAQATRPEALTPYRSSMGNLCRHSEHEG